MNPITGKAHVYGDNIDTDRIIPGKYTKTLDVSQLAEHVLEDLDPEFRHRVQAGDILVAGENFGAGSSREQAPLAIKSAGISVVVARSFARIFYRNAINIGLPVVEVSDHAIENEHLVEVDLENGTVTDKDTGQTYRATQMPEVMVNILNEGGLVHYLRKYGQL
ncbi:MAG: 3-isopropylmalate dehydratase small subunit [Anaerolineae bacterium]|nr:MAG: 3-isopropylmalate dehydratase small subunit [Anaerolineae bacterium]MCL4880025.1 3-isopropylmalate dehydratase small subunit [Anaerolineae bacterium]